MLCNNNIHKNGMAFVGAGPSSSWRVRSSVIGWVEMRYEEGDVSESKQFCKEERVSNGIWTTEFDPSFSKSQICFASDIRALLAVIPSLNTTFVEFVDDYGEDWVWVCAHIRVVVRASNPTTTLPCRTAPPANQAITAELRPPLTTIVQTFNHSPYIVWSHAGEIMMVKKKSLIYGGEGWWKRKEMVYIYIYW